MRRLFFALTLLAAMVCSASAAIHVRSASELQTALHGSAVDTIWVHEGTYRGTFECTIQAPLASPTYVRSFPGERASLDNGGANESILWLKCANVYFVDLDFTNSNRNPPRSEGGVNFGTSSGCKLINCTVRNMGATGINPFWEATNSEIYGCLIYYNGRMEDPEHSNGYGIYGQNNQPSTKLIEANFIGNEMGIFPLHLSGSSAAHIDNFIIRLNTIYGHLLYDNKNPKALIGNFEKGSGQAYSPVIDNNNLFRSDLWLGYNGDGATRVTLTNNYFYNGAYLPTGVDYLVNSGNQFVANDDRVQVIPNKYLDRFSRKRAAIVITNGSLRATVPVTLPSGTLKVGDVYEVRDVQNYYGPPVASGTYQGGALSLPMLGASAAFEAPTSVPVQRPGSSQPRHMDADIAMYILLAGTGAVVPLPSAPSGAFTASTLAGMDSLTSTLSWTSANATSASIDNGIGSVALAGSRSVTVKATTTYRLTLTGPGGTTTYSVSLVVTQSPPPVGCDSVGYYNKGFADGKASVVCPPQIDTTGLAKQYFDRGFTAGAASVICPPPADSTKVEIPVYIDGILVKIRLR